MTSSFFQFVRDAFVTKGKLEHRGKRYRKKKWMGKRLSICMHMGIAWGCGLRGRERPALIPTDCIVQWAAAGIRIRESSLAGWSR